MLVQLKKNWPGGVFRRTPRDEVGKPLCDQIEFRAGVPIEVSDKVYAALHRDIGPALERVEPAPVTRVAETELADQPVDESQVEAKPRRRRLQNEPS